MKSTLILTICLIGIHGLFGCEPEENKTSFDEKPDKFTSRAGKIAPSEKGDLLKKDIPYKQGDIVLLKPDKKPAVIISFAYRPLGIYKYHWSPDGKDKINTGELIEITNLSYLARYEVRQLQPKDNLIFPDEPTEIVHYKTKRFRWYEIFGKKD